MPLPRYASNIIYPVIDQHLHIGNQLLVVFFFFMNYAHVYDIAGVSTPPGYFTKGGKMSVPVPPRFIRLSHLRIIKHSDPLRTDVLSLSPYNESRERAVRDALLEASPDRHSLQFPVSSRSLSPTAGGFRIDWLLLPLLLLPAGATLISLSLSLSVIMIGGFGARSASGSEPHLFLRVNTLLVMMRVASI